MCENGDELKTAQKAVTEIGHVSRNAYRFRNGPFVVFFLNGLEVENIWPIILYGSF